MVTASRRLLATLSVALITSACIGMGSRANPPPSPDESIFPDVVGITTEVKNGPCAAVLLTLESGETVEAFDATTLEGCDHEMTPVLLGSLRSRSYNEGVGPLVMAGTANGASWIGLAPWQSVRKAWCVIFGEGEGAFRDGDTFHLASGVVISAASDLRWLGGVDESELLPLRRDDDFCLDERGQVTGVDVWNAR